MQRMATTPNEVPARLLITAAEFGSLINVSTSHIRRMHRQGRLPKSMHVGRHTLRWSLEEIRDWTDAYCPVREEWEKLKAWREEQEAESAAQSATPA